MARSRKESKPGREDHGPRPATPQAPGSPPAPPTPDSSSSESAIVVRGARVHNLRGIDVSIPRDRLVVLTGVSGSGKSSLAFDTIYAEGQRRYIESLSVYARQYLDQLERPDVDLIEGLPPTVSLDQRTGLASPRSTVATITEVSDYLRLLYARAGIPHCPSCGLPIRHQAPEQIVSGVLALQEGRKVIVMAPLVRGRKGQHAQAFDAIRRAGLIRARVDGQFVEIQDAPPLAKSREHSIEAVVDRLVVRSGIRPRLAESVDRALKLGDGTILLSVQQDDGDTWSDRILSTRLACPDCDVGLEAMEPRSFSFNSPYGACPSCDGLGTLARFDPDLLAPDRSRSLAGGAIVAIDELPPRSRRALLDDPELTAFLEQHSIQRETPLDQWPKPALLQFFAEGKPAKRVNAYSMVEHLERTASGLPDARKAALGQFREPIVCPACEGARLKPEARAVTVAGQGIHHLTALAVSTAREAFESLRFEPPLDRVGPPLVREILQRLDYLDRVGLAYLGLDRRADTLSGGELQRVRMAAQLGSGLVGVGFILDEPTAGLHPRDTDRLLESLRALRDAGNSVIVVEHDEATIRAADWVIDLGPGAGPDGGRIVAEGPPDALQGTESLTVRYLNRAAGTAALPRDRTDTQSWISVIGAREHNLKGDLARFPVGKITCVAGVSGSGKSTLVLDVLARAARRHLEQVGPRPGRHERIEGLEAIDKLIVVDQSPIGRTPRSTPATYTGLFDEIRKVFARTREARVRGYKASRFSFNVKGGRCDTCQGQGLRRIEMRFLPDLYLRCDACDGARFNRQTLEARYKGASISDVLEMRVEEAAPFFDAVPTLRRGLDALREAGLGYVALGQSSTTLSGGEAQRVKLAAELGRVATGRTLFILDEPTTGLHFADVDNLLRVLNRLADLGNTLVIIEHNPDVIRASDWVIDLGPGGGEAGGRVVAMGTPAEIAASKASATGPFLRQPSSAK